MMVTRSGYSIIFGTLKRLSWRAGAFAQHLVGRRLIGDHVLAHRGAGLADLRGRLDVRGVELVELVDIGQDRAQIGVEAPLFLGGRVRAAPAGRRGAPARG